MNFGDELKQKADEVNVSSDEKVQEIVSGLINICKNSAIVSANKGNYETSVNLEYFADGERMYSRITNKLKDELKALGLSVSKFNSSSAWIGKSRGYMFFTHIVISWNSENTENNGN